MVLHGNKYNSPFIPTSTNVEICVATRDFIHNTLVSPQIEKDAHIITFNKLWRNAKFVLAIQNCVELCLKSERLTTSRVSQQIRI
jgi:hypothetical protein